MFGVVRVGAGRHVLLVEGGRQIDSGRVEVVPAQHLRSRAQTAQQGLRQCNRKDKERRGLQGMVIQLSVEWRVSPVKVQRGLLPRVHGQCCFQRD